MKLFSVLLAVPALVAGCGGEREQSGMCPDGETCSSATPEGLDFLGASTIDGIDLAGPLPTAVGGTQQIALAFGGIPVESFDLPYGADDDGGAAVVVTGTQGADVDVRGVATGENYLRIVDSTTGALYDRKMVAAAPATAVTAIPLTGEPSPDGPFAFAAGDVPFGLALATDVVISDSDFPQRVIDTSLTIDGLPAFDQPTWDSIDVTLAAGVYPLTITSGSAALPLQLTVVDHADRVYAPGSQTVIAGASSWVCFDAQATTATETLAIYGLSWTFSTALDPSIATVTADSTRPAARRPRSRRTRPRRSSSPRSPAARARPRRSRTARPARARYRRPARAHSRRRSRRASAPRPRCNAGAHLLGCASWRTRCSARSCAARFPVIASTKTRMSWPSSTSIRCRAATCS